MKNFINILAVVILSVAMASCGGNSATSEKDNSAQVEQQKQDSIREANERAEAERIQKEKEEQARLEAEQKEWHGATSRSDLKSKINGTTWETTSSYSVTGLYYKFVINGNSVKMYSARPTRNYDDPKDWGDSFDMVIEDIAEPQQGLYCVICKAVDDTDARGAVPTILVFQGETVTYSLGGDKGPNMKKVS
ncbi:MAG: hypothetical protein NC301_02860 [Bacteroides sp.]|nr:hypothetical protein [Lachnospiraceae bacterium]MCM1309951.1 hypothetical protein [Bacteroides sp.]MCM1379673.1 hypothetical protein [Bacteroides sp.]MCM1445945.1 hypothetical protein [Prevotella sp.]